MAVKSGFSKTKIWLVFGILFVCGLMVGVGIANWVHSVKANMNVDIEQKIDEPRSVSDGIVNIVRRVQNEKNDETLTTCQTVERVLLNKLRNTENCNDVKQDLEIYRKLATYGCEENYEEYSQEIENKNAILDVACDGFVFDEYIGLDDDVYNDDGFSSKSGCEQIEESLKTRLPGGYAQVSAEQRIERAKIFAVMAERGCPENNEKYTEMAKRELEIARALRDDYFNEDDTIEVVETYKRLKMQRDAEEVFNKVRKLTNPAIDFIMQIEKIINE